LQGFFNPLRSLMRIRLSLIFCAFVFSLTNLSGQQVDKDDILFTVGTEKVSIGEFLYVFEKNNINKDSVDRKTAIDEYLDLYINFKMKVMEAEAMQLHQNANFKKEFLRNKDQLTQSYLTDKNVNESLIEEAYNRMKEEINASHILVGVDPGASPTDTAKAFEKINLIRGQIVDQGKEFGEMAFRYSSDPSAKDNRGNLGFITAFQTVYPFESAAYNTAKDDISQPFRTKYGYHILKIHNRRKASGEITVSHILVKDSKDAPEEIRSKKKAIIDSVYMLLDQERILWEEAVFQFSQDRSTYMRGGKLPAFSTGKMVPNFESAAFALSNDGDLSKPVLTEIGWHIIKRVSLKNLGTLSEEQSNLRQRIEKDNRSNVPKQQFVQRVKRENNFVEYLDARNELVNQLDANVLRQGWKLEDYSRFNKNLFSVGGNTFTQTDFLLYLKNYPIKGKTRSIKSKIRNIYEKFVEHECTELEESLLEEKYPEYNYLLKEYRDGILLFDIAEKKVWSKAMKDMAGMEEFYKEQDKKYHWEERAQAGIYKTTDPDLAKKLFKLAKRNKINAKTAEKYPGIEISNGAFEQNQNKYLNTVKWKSGVYGPDKWEEEYVVIHIKELLEPQEKTFGEAKGYIISDYQAYLEKLWVKELRNKYSLIVNEKSLKSLY